MCEPRSGRWFAYYSTPPLPLLEDAFQGGASGASCCTSAPVISFKIRQGVDCPVRNGESFLTHLRLVEPGSRRLEGII
jgi:hypothetical protein